MDPTKVLYGERGVGCGVMGKGRVKGMLRGEKDDLWAGTWQDRKWGG